jgi:hypothetical protein
MRVIKRDPNKGFLDTMFWIPKTHCNAEGVKRALTFQFSDKKSTQILSLWKEAPNHLLVPREFWDTASPELTFPIVDCRPQSYEKVEIRSRIKLDHRFDNGKLHPTGDTVQREALEAILYNRGGILQLACVSGETEIQLNRGGKGFRLSIEKAYRRLHHPEKEKGPKWRLDVPTYVRAMLGWEKDRVGLQRIKDIIHKGVRKTYELELEDGKKIRVTKDHQVATARGYASLKQDLCVGDLILTDSGQEKWGKKEESEQKKKPVYKRLNWYPSHPFAYKNGSKRRADGTMKEYWVLEEHRAVAEATMNHMTLEEFRWNCRRGYVDDITFIDPDEFHVHHKDEDASNNDPDNLVVLPRREHMKHHQPGAKAFGYGKVERKKLVGIKEHGFESVYDIVCADPHRNFVANGVVVHNCGKGKTVVALELAARLGVPTLIVVDTTQLVGQWREEIELFLDVPGGVGMIGDGEFDWKKSIVIATYHTLGNRASTFPEEARRWFGLVIWDEAHHVAAPTFARSADLFSGRRIGLTATPTRSDGLHVVYNAHIGKVLYKNLTQDLKPDIFFRWTGFRLDPGDALAHVATHDKNSELHLGKLASYFARLVPRLDFILNEVRIAAAQGRKILVLSKSVDETINLLARWNGRPELYTDILYPVAEDVDEKVPPSELDKRDEKKLHSSLDQTKAQLKDPKLNTVKREILTEKKKNIEYRLKQHAVWKKTEALYRFRQREYLKDLLADPSTGGLMIGDVDAKDRMAMLRSKQITFAIMKYGREGLNEKSLDTVLACEPMSDQGALQQLMGRVLREMTGKMQPIVVFIEDDIGPLIGMCQQLKQHLREWPVEDGGPYDYTLVGHPTTRQRRNPWDRKTA